MAASTIKPVSQQIYITAKVLNVMEQIQDFEKDSMVLSGKILTSTYSFSLKEINFEVI